MSRQTAFAEAKQGTLAQVQALATVARSTAIAEVVFHFAQMAANLLSVAARQQSVVEAECLALYLDQHRLLRKERQRLLKQALLPAHTPALYALMTMGR